MFPGEKTFHSRRSHPRIHELEETTTLQFLKGEEPPRATPLPLHVTCAAGSARGEQRTRAQSAAACRSARGCVPKGARLIKRQSHRDAKVTREERMCRDCLMGTESFGGEENTSELDKRWWPHYAVSARNAAQLPLPNGEFCYVNRASIENTTEPFCISL